MEKQLRISIIASKIVVRRMFRDYFAPMIGESLFGYAVAAIAANAFGKQDLVPTAGP